MTLLPARDVRGRKSPPRSGRQSRLVVIPAKAGIQGAGSSGKPLGPVQFATLLAQGDTQLAARAVLRNVLEADELHWLDRLLSFPRHRESSKLNELRRVVERALEGRKGNARRSR